MICFLVVYRCHDILYFLANFLCLVGTLDFVLNSRHNTTKYKYPSELFMNIFIFIKVFFDHTCQSDDLSNHERVFKKTTTFQFIYEKWIFQILHLEWKDLAQFLKHMFSCLVLVHVLLCGFPFTDWDYI